MGKNKPRWRPEKKEESICKIRMQEFRERHAARIAKAKQIGIK